MGNNSQTTQSSQQSSFQPWSMAIPGLQNLYNQMYGLSSNTAPTAQQNQATGNLWSSANNVPTFGPQATGAVNNLFNTSTAPQQGMWNSAFNQAAGVWTPMLSSSYTNPLTAPGLSQALATTNQDITNAVKGQFAAAGRDPSGNAAESQALARGLAQGEAPIITNEFNALTGAQTGAAGALLGGAGNTATGTAGLAQIPLGNTIQGINAAGSVPGLWTAPAQAQLGAANQGYLMPWQNLQMPLTELGGLAGLGGQSEGTGTSTTTQPVNPFTTALGAGLGLAGMKPSDMRIKENIQPVGQLFDETPVYSFNYKGDPSKTQQVGLIAQDVEQRNPEAVSEGPGGVKMVDHAAATAASRRMAAQAADPNAIRGDVPGLSPAMARMVRQGIGKRILSMNPEERVQTAEGATRGAAGVGAFVNPALGAGTAGLTSQFMGDTPQETAEQVARPLLGYGLWKAGAYAPKTSATVAATMLPSSTQSEANDAQKLKAIQAQAEADRAKRVGDRRAAAQALADFNTWKNDPTNVKTMSGFSPEWQAQIKGAADMPTAQGLFLQAAEEKRKGEEFTNWKKERGAEISSFAKPYQARIAGAKNLEEAQGIYDAGAKARKEAGMTWAENNPFAATALEVSLPFLSAAVPAYGRTRALNAVNKAAKAGEGRFTSTFGENAPELTEGRLNEAERAATNIRSRIAETKHGIRGSGITPLELGGGTIAPWLAGTAAPSAIDMAMGSMSSDPGGQDRYNKAVANLENPERLGLNLAEGIGGEMAGHWGANALRGKANVMGRGEASAANLERNIARYRTNPESPGSVLTQATRPAAVPEMPPMAPYQPPPSAPARAPAPAPGLWQGVPNEQLPGYKSGLSGAALTGHIAKLRRDLGLDRQ